MTSTVEKKENNVVTLRLTIPAEDFERGMESAFRRNSRYFSVPGFRKGKAPMNLVLRYYGEGVLYDDALQETVQPALEEAVKEHELEPVSEPRLDIEAIGRGKDLVVLIDLTVKPDVVLGRYRGVEAVKPDVEVNEDLVDQEITRVQERNARMVPVEDRAAEDGDTVTIDYLGEVDGVPFEGGEASDHELTLGSGSFIPGFEEQVVGHSVGESFDVEVTFPEEYHADNLAGAEAVFHVTLNAIRHRELPELDDEFAKDVSEFDTMTEYRDSVREKLVEDAEQRANVVFENNAVRAAVEESQIDVPDVMIETRMDRMAQEQGQRYSAMGISFEQFLQYMNQSYEQFRENFREQAEESVRSVLVLEAVARAENLEATDEDYEKVYEDFAQQSRMEVENVRTMFTENEEAMAQAREQVLVRKAAELIRDSAFAIPEPEPVEVPSVDEDEAGEGEPVSEPDAEGEAAEGEDA